MNFIFKGRSGGKTIRSLDVKPSGDQPYLAPLQ